VAQIVIYKSAGNGGLNEESALAWEALASQLRGLDNEVIREDRYMEPGRRGVVFGEVIAIYIGLKAVDVITDHALEAALERVLAATKEWARSRFRARARPPISISFYDEDGRTIATFTITKDGEQERSPTEDQQPGPTPFGHLAEAAKAGRTIAKDFAGKEPDVWMLLGLTNDDTHLRVDAYVGNEYRAMVDVTNLPNRLIVTPEVGDAVIFHVEEAENELGAQVTANGWRCDLISSQSGDGYVVLCYQES
jgi:hypothetical protein